MNRPLTLVISLVVGATLLACGGSAKLDYPGTEEGARALLTDLMKPDADRAAMTKALEPTDAQYKAYFVGDAAAKAQETYKGLWGGANMVIAPKDGQTELLLESATTEDLQAWNDKAGPFPGGYKDVAAQLKPGVTVYRFKFVKPGETLGMAFDGLAFVEGRWAIFPKPWRALR